jgi:hypothetical protein
MGMQCACPSSPYFPRWLRHDWYVSSLNNLRAEGRGGEEGRDKEKR